MIHQLYKHNDKLYLIKRDMGDHNFKNKDKSINMDVLKLWRDHLDCDHVLKKEDRFLFVETIEEIEFKEIE
jgi:hypothetical protein